MAADHSALLRTGGRPAPPVARERPPPPYPVARERNVADVQRHEYEHVLVMDRSGSMGAMEDCPGKQSRWAYALECAQSFVSKCVKRQGGPMRLVFFATKPKVVENVTAEQLPRLWEENEPSGGTNMADALSLVLETHFSTRDDPRRAKRKLIVVVITDGAPDSREDVANVLIGATYRMHDDSELGFQFIQIGKDPKAAEFLTWLDVALQEDDPTDPEYAKAQRVKRAVGIALKCHARFDIVDTTPADQVDDKGGLDKVLDMALTD